MNDDAPIEVNGHELKTHVTEVSVNDVTRGNKGEIAYKDGKWWKITFECVRCDAEHADPEAYDGVPCDRGPVRVPDELLPDGPVFIGEGGGDD